MECVEEYLEIHNNSDIEDGEIVQSYYLQKVPRIVGVICWNLNGYTITNGVQSISRDETDGNTLEEDISSLLIDRLYIVETCKPILFKTQVLMDPLHPVLFPKCRICQSKMCHRWKAFQGGLQKLVKYHVFTVPH